VISLLRQILCFISNITYYVEKAAIFVINLIIYDVSIAIGVIVALFPDMPELPEWGGGALALDILNWIVPLAAIVGIFATVITIMAIVLVMRVAAKWVKLL